MASFLPKFVVLNSGGYVFFMHAKAGERGYVSCTGKTAFDPYAKIAVERSTTNSKYVHLRFCASNRYWARSDSKDGWIFATSSQPVEDLTKPTCTLFEPAVDRTKVAFLYPQSKGEAVVRDGATSRLCIKRSGKVEFFDFLDWETLVQLPKHVAFKGYNDKYVDVVRAQKREYLRCLSEDGNKKVTSYESQTNQDGFLRLKSLEHNTFWVRTGIWVAADSTDKDGKDRETLFWPVKVDAKTLALRTAVNNLFVAVQNTKKAYLSSEVSSITNEARFTVEELVLERSIFNTRYRVEDARIFDETPFVAGSNTAVNDTNRESSMTVLIRFEEYSSSTFSNSVSITLGVSTSINAGIPFIAGGTIDISTEVSTALEWSKTKAETKVVEATYTVMVPPMTTVLVTYVGTRGTCDVPFSYSQRDVSSTDGRIITSQHDDGVFNGVSCYNYQFTQPRFSSLLQIDE